MKIAVASMDGVSISPHFGRSESFIVFEADESRITGREVRPNTFTAHAQGQCHGHEAHEAYGHDQPHSHAGIVNALSDCQVVLCYGMGWRAAEDLKLAGIQALVLDAEATAEEAVQAFLAGKVKPGKPFCRCHEHQ
ncbi:MAG: NifB/NifX family molybdenum-iron cluster-binding protein [Planctomycetota bacterium]|nr:NifB/NifX family molybdenum-iron cluster-binding protein [Planctomycetota bacterium]